MNARYLLDTHIVVRWLATPKKLSREQSRALRDAVRRQEPVAVSAITLLELAVLCSQGALDAKVTIDDLFHQLESNPAFEIAPLTVAVATEVAAIGSALRDPADRAIVATARIERLRLITSDQRIIESNLVSVIT